MGKRFVYLAGAISNCPNYEQYFQRAEDLFKSNKYIEVWNPVKIIKEKGINDYESIMRECLKLVKKANYLALLPTWQQSEGAKREKKVFETKRNGVIFRLSEQRFADLSKGE